MLVAAPAPAPASETKRIQTLALTKEEKPSSSSKDKKEEQVLQQQTEEDMISKLVDNILLLILENVNLTTSVRASVLSKRWRHLPWLLSQLSIDIKDFLHEPYDHDHPAVDDGEKAMSSLTEAVRNMLALTRRKSVITRLCISFFITSGYSNEVGHLVNEAIENGMVKDIELKCGIQMMPATLSEEEMANHADSVISFFRNYPNVYCCLTSLSLYNARFDESDLHNLLANKCTELRYLYLNYCDTGFYTSFKIDVPDSKLNVLEFSRCTFDQIWLQPEKDQLRSGFSNLKQLYLHDIFVGFGLMWTTTLLEAAPSLEILRVELYDHRRCQDEEKKKQIYGERTNAPWEVSKSSPPPHSSLKELQLFGFNATEQHMAFIGAVMERASNLQSVVLKEHYCKSCDAVIIPNFVECGFPKNKDEQDKIRNQFTSCAQIIFREDDFSSV